MSRQCVNIALFMGLGFGTSIGGESPPAPYTPLPPSAGALGRMGSKIVLAVDPSTIGVGGAFKVRCEVWGGQPAYLFNPSLWEGRELPAQIVLTSADGKLRCELLRAPAGDAKSGTHSDWSYLRGGQAIGRELMVSTAKEPLERGSGLPCIHIGELSPGEYFVQLICNHRLIEGGLDGPGPDGSPIELHRAPVSPTTRAGLREQLDRALAVSEPVRLIVKAKVPITGIKPPESSSPLRVELHNLNVQGTKAGIDIRMVNQSDTSMEVYRAFKLHLYRDGGSHVGDLLTQQNGSRRSPERFDWVTLGPGGVSTFRFHFDTDYEPSPFFESVPRQLARGKYYIELKAHASAISGMPPFVKASNDTVQNQGYPTYPEWLSGFPGPEICRSNRVELEILPRAGD